MAIFNKIEQRTVEKDIVNAIREAIVDGRLELGSHLTESDLSLQMHVSRIPIREALRLLEQEGLVTRQTNRGCSVIKFTPYDVVEVFSLRATLECMGYEQAIPRLTDDDFNMLEEIIAKQEIATSEGDLIKLAKLDMQFHEYILIKANHSRLLKVWYEQYAQCCMLLNLRFRVWADYTPRTVTTDHGDILQALRKRDVQTAIALTKKICTRVSTECIQALAQQDKPV